MRQEICSRALLCLVGFGLTLTLTFCDKSDGLVDTASSATGIVSDSITGLPIDSAIIASADSTYIRSYTDSTGFYSVVRWGAGEESFAVIKTGYETKLKTIYLSGDMRDVDIQLVPSQQE